MITIDSKSIDAMIKDVAPRVHHLTQMDPHIESLRVSAIRRRDYFAEVVLPKFEGMGIDSIPHTELGQLGFKIMKYVTPFSIMAEYDPINHKMFILYENFGWGTNKNGLTTVLGHELVHRCQFLDNPHFLDTYKFLLKKVLGSNVFDLDEDEDKTYMPFIQPFMTLVEGDATFVQGQLKEWYPGAKYKSTQFMNFLDTVVKLSKGSNGKRDLSKKLMQYQRGRRIIRDIYKESGRGAINQLYALDYKQIQDVFSFNPQMYKRYVKI